MSISLEYICGVTVVNDHRRAFEDRADMLPLDIPGLVDVIPYVYGNPGARYIELDATWARSHKKVVTANLVKRLAGKDAPKEVDAFYKAVDDLDAGKFKPAEASIVLRIYAW